MSITRATLGASGIDLGTLRAAIGMVTLDSGFVNTAGCTSVITYINGEASVLRYRGYPIGQLAEHSRWGKRPEITPGLMVTSFVGFGDTNNAFAVRVSTSSRPRSGSRDSRVFSSATAEARRCLPRRRLSTGRPSAMSRSALSGYPSFTAAATSVSCCSSWTRNPLGVGGQADLGAVLGPQRLASLPAQ
jgi:hypothetical protein